jgi:hypothetical protein
VRSDYKVAVPRVADDPGQPDMDAVDFIITTNAVGDFYNTACIISYAAE